MTLPAARLQQQRYDRAKRRGATAPLGHRVIKRTDPRGGVITFQYDSAGRTTKETLEDGSSTIQYAYTTVGNLVTQTNMTDPLGRVTEYRFNGQGYETRKTDALVTCSPRIVRN